MAAKRTPASTSGSSEDESGITQTGVKKSLWFHQDEAEALRTAAFHQRRSEASIIREAVRRYLGLED